MSAGIKVISRGRTAGAAALLGALVLSASGQEQSVTPENPPPPAASTAIPEDVPQSARLTPRRGDWQFTLAPYLWASSLSAEVEAGPISTNADACFTDLLKNLDMAVQLRFEGMRDDRWGFFVDGTYLRLGEDARARVGPFRVRGLDIDAQFTQAWLDFGGMYRFAGHGHNLDLMLGGRYAHVASDVSVGPFLDLDQSLDFVAPLLGGRWQHDLSDRWLLALHGDVGGFGVGDAADLFWGLTALVGYRLNERATLGFGYRFYDIDYDSGPIAADVQFHGPIVGVAFKF
jgi:opacity protein-like surface antigen